MHTICSFIFRIHHREVREIIDMEFNRIEKSILASVTGIIIGPTSFTVDSKKQVYKVFSTCPSLAICLWQLDGRTIFEGPDTSVALQFDQMYIGNRTLSYVSFIGGISQTLASLLISILPSTTPGRSLNTVIYLFTCKS